MRQHHRQWLRNPRHRNPRHLVGPSQRAVEQELHCGGGHLLRGGRHLPLVHQLVQPGTNVGLTQLGLRLVACELQELTDMAKVALSGARTTAGETQRRIHAKSLCRSLFQSPSSRGNPRLRTGTEEFYDVSGAFGKPRIGSADWRRQRVVERAPQGAGRGPPQVPEPTAGAGPSPRSGYVQQGPEADPSRGLPQGRRFGHRGMQGGRPPCR